MKSNERGITIIALVITVIILGLISVPIVINTSQIKDFNNYKKLKDDIDNLRENIKVAFYEENISGIGPKVNSSMLGFLSKNQNGDPVKNANDNDVYYAISVDEINKRLSQDISELNYGFESSGMGTGENYHGSDDVYIINEASLTIYYIKGVEYKGNVYYRLAEDFSTVNEGVKPGVIVTGLNKS